MTLTHEKAFQQFYDCLLEEYPMEWSLTHHILKTLPAETSRTRLQQLFAIARKAADLGQFEAELPSNAFVRIVIQAIYLIRATAMKLFVDGKNQGYQLALSKEALTPDEKSISEAIPDNSEAWWVFDPKDLEEKVEQILGKEE